MPNLKIGDTVFYAGKKRTVEALKKACGHALVKMSGHAFMVRSDLVKPVVRVTERVRAGLLVEVFGERLRGYQGGAPVVAVTTHDGKVLITREEYEAAWEVLHPSLRTPLFNSRHLFFKLKG